MVPLSLPVPGGDSFSPEITTPTPLKIFGVYPMAPLLWWKSTVAQWMTVLWDLFYIFHWMVVNHTILPSLKTSSYPPPSTPRLSNYTLWEGNILHYYFLQFGSDFLLPSPFWSSPSFHYPFKRQFFIGPFPWCKVSHNPKLSNAPHDIRTLPNLDTPHFDTENQTERIQAYWQWAVAIFCFFPSPAQAKQW